MRKKWKKSRRRLLAILFVVPLLLLLSAGFDKRTVTLVSAGGTGTPGNEASHHASITADGRHIAFSSKADNLVPGDTNGTEDIFVKNVDTGAVVRVSTNSAGEELNGDSAGPVISADGNSVAFKSYATDLIPGASGLYGNLFVKNLQTGAISLVSADAAGNAGNAESTNPVISADGRYVAFASDASNLVPEDTNGYLDIYVRDLATGSITLVSVGAGGEAGDGSSGDIYGPSISADGMRIAFSSSAANIAPGDSDNVHDILVKDTGTGEIFVASMGEGGAKGNGNSLFPGLSADGKRVAYRSQSTNLHAGDREPQPDIYVKDLETRQLFLASTDAAGNKGNMPSWDPAISPNGRKAAFSTDSTNLGAAGMQNFHIYLKDLEDGSLTLVSANADGVPANGVSTGPTFSRNGTRVAYDSQSSNLVSGAPGNAFNIYLTIFESAEGPAGGCLGLF